MGNQQSRSQDSKGPTVNVLLLGMTGAGKSTGINMLINYFRGVKNRLPKASEIRVAIPTEHIKRTTEPEGAWSSESDVTNVAQSQTQKCTTYIFTCNSALGAVSLQVIDTPGLADVQCKDQENIENILKTMADLGTIHAVALVVSGTEGRAYTSMQSAFSQIKGHMPDSVAGNVMAIVTKCRPEERVINLNHLPIRVKPKYVCHMQNSIFLQDPKTWRTLDTATYASLERSYLDSMQTVHDIMLTALSMKPVSTEDFKTMRDLRMDLRIKMMRALTELRNMQTLHAALEKAKLMEKAAEGQAKDSCQWMKQTTVKQMEIVDAPYHSTMCTVCQTICHDRCSLIETRTVGHERFEICLCMHWNAAVKGYRCSHCKAGCSPATHVHDRKKWQQVEVTTEHVMDEIKRKHDTAKSSAASAQAQGRKVQADISLLEAVQAKKLEEVKAICREIKAICKNFNLTDELAVVLQALRAEKAMLTRVEDWDRADAIINDMSRFISDLSGGLPGCSAGQEPDLDYSSLLHKRRGPVAQSRGHVVPQRAPHVMQRSHGQNSDPDRSFRNRNNPIGMHASQNGQKMQGSGASRSICTFYNTDRGCRNGDTCTYAHVMRPPAACSNGHMHSQAASGSGGPVSRGAQQHALRITASGSAAQGNFSGNVAHMPGYMSAPAPAPAPAPVQSIAYEEALVCQYSVEADKIGSMPMVIGSQGAMLKRLRAVTGCEIIVPPFDIHSTQQLSITLQAVQAGAIDAARTELDKILASASRPGSAASSGPSSNWPCQATYWVAPSKYCRIGGLIGPDGATIRRICWDTGCDIDIPKQRSPTNGFNIAIAAPSNEAVRMGLYAVTAAMTDNAGKAPSRARS